MVNILICFGLIAIPYMGLLKFDGREPRIDNAGKRLEEAISRRLIAKKNAEKQRSKYVRRKGEVPPIMTPKNRHKFTDKEVNKLKGVLGKQKAQRGEVRDFALMRKKGIIKATPVAPPAPEEDAMKSTTVYAAPPTPGVIQRVPGPKPLHAEDAFKQGLDHFTRTGDSNSLDVAKRAAASMYSQELISLGKLSFRDGKDKHNSYKMAKDRYNNNINSVDAMYRINNSIENPPKPKKGFMDKIKGLIRK